MRGPALGVEWSRHPELLRAFAPLLDEGAYVLQLTVEQAFGAGDFDPAWVEALDRAAEEGDLVAHGVHASPWTVPRDRIAEQWLARTKAVLKRWPARWLTDHIGCCRGAGWHAAPVPLPPSRALVAAGRDHLAWLRDALEIPVGLENLALAFSVDDVLAQPDLVDATVRPLGGLVLLDLHNLWCQAVNFGLDAVALLERYPLDLVRQIHVAGGRVSSFPEGRFRRDTHDGPVPDEVWQLVPEAVARCPNLEVAVFERLAGDHEDAAALRQELGRLAEAMARPAFAGPVDALPACAPWSTADPALAGPAVFEALRARDDAALARVFAPWPVDPRAARVAFEITERWGRVVPGV